MGTPLHATPPDEPRGQENTLRLLDAVIDSAPDLELSGLEGDAAFVYVTEPSAEITRSLGDLATTMRRSGRSARPDA